MPVAFIATVLGTQTALPIIPPTDDSAHWRPFQYEKNIWGCHLNFKFPTVKLIDFRVRQEILSKSKNLIAKVIEAHLTAINTRKNAQLKFENKLKLVKNLYSLGYNGDDIRALYEFIDYTISLPTDLEERLISEVHKYEEGINMGYITNAERIGMQRGMEQGLGLGKKMFLFVLQNKYFPSNIPEKVSEKVQNATQQELEHWLKEILDEKFQIADFV